MQKTKNVMKGLTAKEEEIMGFFWEKGTLKNVISKYFNNSYLGAVSSLVKEEDISLEELKQLIQEVEKGKE